MNQAKNSTVFEYDPQIYPRKLWVINGWNDKLTTQFCTLDGECFFIPAIKQYAAVTSTILRRVSDNSIGVLVVLNCNKHNKNNSSELAHEAVHATNCIFNDLKINYTQLEDECFAYFVGWVVSCLEKTLDRTKTNHHHQTK